MAKNVDWEDWKVQLAYSYTGNELQNNEWFSLSQKINGVRATYFADELITRSGKNIQGVEILKHYLHNLYQKLNRETGRFFVFDGELRIMDNYASEYGDDNAVFKASVGIVNSTRDFTEKYKLGFIIFDIIPVSEFVQDFCTMRFKERHEILYSYISDFCKDTNGIIQVVKNLYTGTNQNVIYEYLDYAERNNWEGLMINRNAEYAYTRTKGLLKVKKFNTIDLKVVGCEQGTGKYENTLGALLCKYKDNIVGVGTGFDDITRDIIWAQRDHLEGKLCEIKYKDITCDKYTGLESLQFPVFVCFKHDKIKPDA